MIIRLFIVFLLISTNLTIFAQDNMDQLIRKLEQKKGFNMDTLIELSLRLDSLATATNHNYGILLAGVTLTDIYGMKGESAKAKFYAEKTLPYAEDDYSKANLLHAYSTAIMNEDSEKAERLLEQAMAIGETTSNEPDQLTTMYANYAKLKHKRGDLEEAIRYLERALSTSTNAFITLQIYINLSDILVNTGNWIAAEDYIMRSIDLSEKEGYKMRNGAPGLFLARLLVHQGRDQEAEIELQKCLSFFKSRKLWKSHASTLRLMLKIPLKNKEYAIAKALFDSNESFIEKAPTEQKIKILLLRNHIFEHENNFQKIVNQGKEIEPLFENWNIAFLKKNHATWMYKAYSKLGKFEQAFSYLSQKEQLADSLYRSGQIETVNKMEAEFNRKEKNKEIDNLAFRNKIQRNSLWGGGLALLVISIFSFVLYRLWKKVSSQRSQLALALNQKDTLLREIHHRVKNNLQLVSSLLSLQGSKISDDTALEAIKAGKSRVQSMALIHQDLYNKENLTDVNVKQYLDKLGDELQNSFSVDPEKIAMVKNIENLDIDVDTLLPLGLIMNELITNSLKYAFPGDRKGTINLDLKKHNNSIVFSIADDGIGFNPENKRAGSFGGTLVNALVGQLEANMESNSSNGTKIQINIPYTWP